MDNQVSILHLISDDKLVHTVNFRIYDESNYLDLLDRLLSEATGKHNQIIMCDEDNNPVEVLEYKPEEPTKPKESPLIWAIVAFVLGLFLYMF
jgi:hypothetical protein